MNTLPLQVEVELKKVLSQNLLFCCKIFRKVNIFVEKIKYNAFVAKIYVYNIFVAKIYIYNIFVGEFYKCAISESFMGFFALTERLPTSANLLVSQPATGWFHLH